MSIMKIVKDDAIFLSLLSDRQASPGIQSLNLSNFEHSMAPATETKEFR